MDIVIILLWVSAIPSGLKYFNLLKQPKHEENHPDENKIKSAKRSFYCSLFLAIGGTIATILGI